MAKALPRDIAVLVLRLAGLGLAFAHGWGKVVALAAGEGDRLVAGVEALGFPAPTLFAWAAALSELVGGLFVALGLATRVAALFAAVTMAVAAFLRHRFHFHLLDATGLVDASPDELERWGNPEMALVYLLVFLAVALTGPGRFSFDHLVRGRRR